MKGRHKDKVVGAFKEFRMSGVDGLSEMASEMIGHLGAFKENLWIKWPMKSMREIKFLNPIGWDSMSKYIYNPIR